MSNQDDLKSLDIESLRRKDLGRDLQFDDIIDVVDKIKKGLLYFNDDIRNKLVSNDKREIDELTKQYLHVCTLIKTFKQITNENLSQSLVRKEYISSKLRELNKKYNQDIAPLIVSLEFDKEEISKIPQVIEKTLQEQINKMDEATKNTYKKQKDYEDIFNAKIQQCEETIKGIDSKARSVINEIEDIKQKARDFSTDAVVKKYGSIFKNQSEVNKKIAIISLGFLVISVASLILLTDFLFSPLMNILLMPNNNISSSYLITSLIYRLTILSVLFIAIKESLKNFNVNMHLYNLNKHRQNALESFDVFKGMPIRSDTKDYLIKEIANTIYSVNRIGYLSDTKKTSDFSQLVELLKLINPK